MSPSDEKSGLEQSLEELEQALVHNWGIWPVGRKHLAREALIDELSRRVDFLMKHDFQRLCYCMYTIDVPEERFSEAVRMPEEEHPAKVIAELILEREVQKMQTRHRYMRRERTEVTITIPSLLPHPKSDREQPGE